MTQLNQRVPQSGQGQAPGGVLRDRASGDERETTAAITIRWRACGPGLGERRGYVLGREVLDICHLRGHGEYVLRFACREQGRFATIARAKGYAGQHVADWWAAWQVEMAAADEAARREAEAAELEAEVHEARSERLVRMRRRIAALREAIHEAGQGLIARTTEVQALIATVLAELEEDGALDPSP